MQDLQPRNTPEPMGRSTGCCTQALLEPSPQSITIPAVVFTSVSTFTMSKLLVVVGATGHQGHSVISYFQRTEPSWKIRGLTRNPSSAAATALAKSGVEVVKADLNDLSSLKEAFAGANYIFAFTDFAGIIGSPEVMGKFQAGQLAPPIGAECFKIEVQHGKNIADAAASVPELEPPQSPSNYNLPVRVYYSLNCCESSQAHYNRG